MTQPQVFVTTSWDDGHVLDLKIAEMLHRYGLTGTFYIAPRSVELRACERLASDEIRFLAGRFEIGGHTLTHRRLPSLTAAQAAADIIDGKDELEQILGTRLQSFAYPAGRYDRRHVGLVRAAGFVVGRTVRRHVIVPPADLLQLPTTVHAYRHWRDLPVVAKQAELRPNDVAGRFWHWDQLANALFDRVLSRGGVFHLWGHSWEVDDRGDWSRLARVMAYVGGRPEVTYITNGDVSQLTARSRAPR